MRKRSKEKRKKKGFRIIVSFYFNQKKNVRGKNLWKGKNSWK
jgi:hypothetical protein